MELTQERLKQILHYEPETGKWTWLIQTQRSQTKPGDLAGRINKTLVRLEIGISGKRYSASRLAWLYMTGEWPAFEVDHQDTDALNNRWENLRLATRSQNESNKGLTKRNSSGFKGVSWDASRGQWKAQIGAGGKNRLLGRFPTPEEAYAVYCEAAEKAYGEFVRLA